MTRSYQRSLSVGPSFAAALLVVTAPASHKAIAQSGACCLEDGACIPTDAAGCVLFDGTFLGAGTICPGDNCEGACCMPDGTCIEDVEGVCAPSAFQGFGSACATHCPGALGTGFTYQGRLRQNGAPVTGMIDLDAALWTTAVGGSFVGSPVMLSQVEVTDGLFTVQLDFGVEGFDGSQHWLEISVNGSTLSPRQPVSPAPYALQTRGLFVNAGRHVGIGTADPQAQLHIDGQATSTVGLRMQQPGASTGEVQIGSPAGSPGIAAFANNGNRRDIRFTDDGLGLWTRNAPSIPGTGNGLFIDESGSVGIGTAAPDAKLHAVTTANTNPALRLQNEADTLDIRANSINTEGDGLFGDPLYLNNESGQHVVMGIGNSHVGIGTALPSTRLHVTDDRNCNIVFLEPDCHTAFLENTGSTSFLGSSNVLALKANHENAQPGGDSNFITFYDKADDIVGQIYGDENGGISLDSFGADYAEWLPRHRADESFEPGDIVGIVAGEISKVTWRAERVAVGSSAPIVVGNRPKDSATLPTHAKVAFLGQAPVKVRGPVRAGEFIVASGTDDGIGIAVPMENLDLEQLRNVVGRSWEHADGQGIKKVNCVIEPAATGATAELLISRLKTQGQCISELQSHVEQLERERSELDRRLERLEQALARVAS